MKHLSLYLLILLCFSCSTKQTTISSSQKNKIDSVLENNCSEIINYLIINNWRKHTTENAFVVDGTFSSFYKILDSNKYSNQHLTVKDMVYIFGKPTSYPKEKLKGSEIKTYEYLILERDSVPRKKQKAYHYIFRDTLGNGTVIFSKDIEVDFPSFDID